MLVASVMMCMNFMPMEYDLHPNEFYACSMTFILSAVHSSYHGKTCELHTAIILQTALLGQRSSKSVDYLCVGKFTLCKMQHDAAVNSVSLCLRR